MTPFPDRAQVVVIGAGIVGNAVVHHLARLGWRDILLVDKGPLPDPGGSTGHASNFVFPVDHSREITLLTGDSVRQYTELGTLTTCGGIEVARTPERVQELDRRMSSARAWGIDAELITPAEVVDKVPFLDPSPLLGAFWTPSVAVVDPLRAGELSGAFHMDKAGVSRQVQQLVELHAAVLELLKGPLALQLSGSGSVVVIPAVNVSRPSFDKQARAHVPVMATTRRLMTTTNGARKTIRTSSTSFVDGKETLYSTLSLGRVGVRRFRRTCMRRPQVQFFSLARDISQSILKAKVRM